MAIDKAVDSAALETGLTKVANAIRTKGGTSGKLAFPDGMAEAVAAIEAGGGAKEPYVEYTVEPYGSNFRSIAAELHGFTKIPYGLFNANSMLVTVTGIEPVTHIYDYAFSGCNSLVMDSLPDKLEYIGNYAFSSCKKLGLTKLPDNLKKIAARGFYGAKVLITALPDGIESLGDAAFEDCNDIVLTYLPSSLKSIGSSAFASCDKITITTIPDGVETIDSSTFYGCNGITRMTIPASVKSINFNAFKYCRNLKKITFKGTPSDYIRNDVFTGCTNLLTINVPWAEGAVANAPWSATNATINYNYVEAG